MTPQAGELWFCRLPHSPLPWLVEVLAMEPWPPAQPERFRLRVCCLEAKHQGWGTWYQASEVQWERQSIPRESPGPPKKTPKE